MRAYAVDGSELLGGLLDFPVPAHGPSFVWVGYWLSANARRARATPILRIGTAAKGDSSNLHHRLHLRQHEGDQLLSRKVTMVTPHGVQERPLVSGKTGEAFADFEDDDTAVTLVVRDLEAAPANLTLTRWADREKLINEWISLFD